MTRHGLFLAVVDLFGPEDDVDDCKITQDAQGLTSKKSASLPLQKVACGGKRDRLASL